MAKPVLQKPNEWKAYRHCWVISGLSIVAGLVISFFDRPIDPAAMLFILAMPMCFWFVAYSQQRQREQIERLEARINELEGKRLAA